MDTKAGASCPCGGIVAEVDLDQFLMVNNAIAPIAEKFPGTRMLWPTLRGYVPDEFSKLVDETLQERNPVS